MKDDMSHLKAIAPEQDKQDDVREEVTDWIKLFLKAFGDLYSVRGLF